MKLFTELFNQLDQTNKTNAKIAAIKDYLGQAADDDAAWAVYLLAGNKLKRTVSSTKLKTFTMEIAGIPEWLFNESRITVGESAETVALLLGKVQSEVEAGLTERKLSETIENVIIPLQKMDESEQFAALREEWSRLSRQQMLVFNKLLNGHFRLGVSRRIVMRAMAEFTGLEVDIIALRLMGVKMLDRGRPTAEFYQKLINKNLESDEKPLARPYPFHLAHPFNKDELANLGDAADWQAEWKWDGIRCQLIKREGQIFLWSRGEDLITEQYPEIVAAADGLPDGTVLDGELLVWADNTVRPFADLQKRIGRKKVSQKFLDEYPVALLCYDLLEAEGEDLRATDLRNRRRLLEKISSELKSDQIFAEPVVQFDQWQELAGEQAKSRELRVEGLMLKDLNSVYAAGRKKGLWWKWKVDPFSVDAVMIYAQKGTGKRAGLFTDYTFALWADVKDSEEGARELVPFAKAYSGLTDQEINSVNAFVKKHTKDRFGPVRAVTPKLVMEIAFEGISRSNRHKAGYAVRFPRILRIRTDKKPGDADSLSILEDLIND